MADILGTKLFDYLIFKSRQSERGYSMASRNIIMPKAFGHIPEQKLLPPGQKVGGWMWSGLQLLNTPNRAEADRLNCK